MLTIFAHLASFLALGLMAYWIGYLRSQLRFSKKLLDILLLDSLARPHRVSLARPFFRQLAGLFDAEFKDACLSQDMYMIPVTPTDLARICTYKPTHIHLKRSSEPSLDGKGHHTLLVHIFYRSQTDQMELKSPQSWSMNPQVIVHVFEGSPP